MRRTIIIALAATMTAVVAVPAAAYYLNSGEEDLLSNTLSGYGFVPIKPPSNLMIVGSLYYVDAAVRDFKAICHPAKSDLTGMILESRSWEMQESLERNGRFATNVTVDFSALFNGTSDANHVQRLHASLTEVVLEEIPLGDSSLIFAKLMERQECNTVAMQYIRAGGYVCQGQKILHATAEFKLDRDVQNKIATKAKVTTDEIRDLVKGAVEAQSEHSVVERDGRLFSGAALNYGVSMNPMCLAPPDAHFARILPRTTFGRVVNFVLFNIIEPMLPKDDPTHVAQNARY